ncbi:MAG: hypothetical protein DI592_14945, partial [Stenotrophomonas maltophilia]
MPARTVESLMHAVQALDARSAFNRDIDADHLVPLWEQLHSLVPRAPAAKVEAALWRYRDLRPHLMRAGGLLTAAEAIRRVLVMENPAIRGRASVTQSLYAGLQLILPGEVAPSHRHTQSALRLNATPAPGETHLSFGAPGPLSLSETGDLTQAAVRGVFEQLAQIAQDALENDGELTLPGI